MSHSQFHSTNLFILRHAWLNLWDKHMTTGRINQVTTFQLRRTLRSLAKRPHTHSRSCFRGREFVNLSWLDLTVTNTSIPRWSVLASKGQQSNRLVPRSHILQTRFSLSQTATEITAFRENYQQPVTLVRDVAQSRRIPEWLNATGLAISK